MVFIRVIGRCGIEAVCRVWKGGFEKVVLVIVDGFCMIFVEAGS